MCCTTTTLWMIFASLALSLVFPIPLTSLLTLFQICWRLTFASLIIRLISLKLYFVFELACINNMQGFHCDNSCMCTVSFEQVHPLHYIPTPPFTLLFQMVMDSLCLDNFFFIYYSLFIYLIAYYNVQEYIVTFKKVFTKYLSWIHPLHLSTLSPFASTS
jgi:hypothetical protein